jgi:hypothetical protein
MWEVDDMLDSVFNIDSAPKKDRREAPALEQALGVDARKT